MYVLPIWFSTLSIFHLIYFPLKFLADLPLLNQIRTDNIILFLIKRIFTDLLDASNSLADRLKLVEECQSKIETGLELLGATAVEDALQDNVKDTFGKIYKEI